MPRKRTKKQTIATEMVTSESEHWYSSPTRPDVWYPSVTTILSVFPKGVGFNKYLTAQTSWESSQEALKKAGQRGTNVHQATELLDRGFTLSREGYSLEEWQMLIGFVNWYKIYKPKLLFMEKRVVSDNIGTGGTIDRIY